MLERISEINGIGLLHQANGKPHTCHKATLIYADNGRGKSTLATVLRSVSNGDALLVSNRKTVDGKLAMKVVLQFGSGHKVYFDNGAWSEKRPEILVFDADFIERNVHSGGTVSTDHRKNLLEFALGEQAVTARENVETATAEAKAATEQVQKLSEQLSGNLTGMTLSQFENLQQVADADIKITELQNQINAAGNVSEILSKLVPSAISEPTFDIDDLFAGLSLSLENVHAEAEQIVKQHVAKLQSKGAESWLSQGRQFSDHKTCPYCGQGTAQNILIKAYQTHFNAAYSELKAKVSALHRLAEIGTTLIIVDSFSQGVATVNAQVTAWSEQVQTPSIFFDVDSSRLALDELQKLMLSLTKKKLGMPDEPLGSSEEKRRAEALWQKVIAPMQAANTAINTANNLITTYKGKLTSVNVEQLKSQLRSLQATKRRYDTQVVSIFDQLGLARKAAETAEKSKKIARDTLDTLMTTTLQQYEGSINKLLRNFGASFSIKGMGANFRGSAPRSEYGLLLRGRDVALDGKSPSFATALSEGDRRTLAFAFFIASTLSDAKLATRSVVIDDPMCSLDLNRKHHTRSALKKIYEKSEQLIVLAHDPYFIRDLRDTLFKLDPTSPISLFQLALAPEGYSDFSEFDVDKECESVYFQHHRLLNEVMDGNSGDARSVAKAIRPMLEGYLHRRFPGLIPKSLMFGQVVVLIRDAPILSPLCHAQNLVDELNEINEYAGQFHHDTNPSGAESVNVVVTELKIYVERSLHVVHKGAPLT